MKLSVPYRTTILRLLRLRKDANHVIQRGKQTKNIIFLGPKGPGPSPPGAPLVVAMVTGSLREIQPERVTKSLGHYQT